MSDTIMLIRNIVEFDHVDTQYLQGKIDKRRSQPIEKLHSYARHKCHFPTRIPELLMHWEWVYHSDIDTCECDECFRSWLPRRFENCWIHRVIPTTFSWLCHACHVCSSWHEAQRWLLRRQTESLDPSSKPSHTLSLSRSCSSWLATQKRMHCRVPFLVRFSTVWCELIKSWSIRSDSLQHEFDLMTIPFVSFYLNPPKRPAFVWLIFQVSVFVVTTVHGSIHWIALKGFGVHLKTCMSVLACIVICAVRCHLDHHSRNHLLSLIAIRFASHVPDPRRSVW